MNALLVLFAGSLSGEAVQPLAGGKSSLYLALERSQRFPGVQKTVLLTTPLLEATSLLEATLLQALVGEIHVEKRDSWTVLSLLETIAVHSTGFDLTYYAWADCPFLDPDLAGKLAERHLQYAAEYSYADGWPYGLAPELLSPGTAAILAKILGGASCQDASRPDTLVRRDALFSVIQKDINSFDIETEISPVDLRCHRLNLCADSKRNMLLLQRFVDKQPEIPDTAAVTRIVTEQPEILRTVPAFYPVQVYGGCPQSCVYCPWPQAGGLASGLASELACETVTERRDYMEAQQFDSLLEKIVAFSGDAVIDLSLWGELSLHPQKMELIEMVLRRPQLSLIIETSGIGWTGGELERSAELARVAAERLSSLPPLSWIVSLDAVDPARYKEIRGAGFAEANDCAKKLLALFPSDTYVQAVRMTGAEDDIERFYRSWKETINSANIIIQKYDDFCGKLPRKQASDLSPVQRQPCWHLMRDMPVLLDGTVPLCRQQIAAAAASASSDAAILGNAFTEALDVIWERGQKQYAEQAQKKYDSLCAGCDEYYTYNF